MSTAVAEMRRLVALLTTIACMFAFASAASATTTDPRLDAVASRIAGQEVSVLCYERGEPDDPFATYGAWGYVWPDVPTEHMAAEVCEGALALDEDNQIVPDWKKALGALVLAHESYHLAKRYRDRGNEAQTECRAIRHVRYTMVALGATDVIASRLMGWALALHWRIAAKVPEYHLAGCKVPNPY